MLQELRIRNFAIIQSLEVTFDGGLTILSGETGAGKSILVGALGLLLGGRATSEMIRTGADEASVAAVFDIGARDDVRAMLSSSGVMLSDGYLIVRRIISRSGKNKIYIGDAPASLQLLGQVGGRLIDISGQYSQQMLLQVDNHIEILDAFGNSRDVLEAYALEYDILQRERQELQRLQAGEQRRLEQIDLLQFQHAEIEQARLAPGEDQELERERTVLQNAGSLYERTYGAYRHLYEDEQACLGTLQRIAREVRLAADLDATLRAAFESLEQAAATIEDAAFEFRTYAERVTVDPARLEAVEERLELLQRLKRKYGGSLAAVLERYEACGRELESLSGSTERIGELRRGIADRLDGLWQLAAALTEKRTAAAGTLQKKVAAELKAIGMPKARFSCRIETAPRSAGDDSDVAAAGLTRAGCDRVEFYIATNEGEAPKPLSKIASGGEISRIVLALKKILARNYRVPTLLFDEVDAGIGGAIADAVGSKLKEIARDHQVLCITHLPQIACFGSCHFSVSKNSRDGRTLTEVSRLDEQGRLAEISRMLGGKRVSEATREHAREMLRQAQ